MKPLVITVNVHGVDIDMEVDTGASVSLISEETFHQLQLSMLIAPQPSTAKLVTYTKEAIVVAGSVKVKVEHNKQRVALLLISMKGAAH